MSRRGFLLFHLQQFFPDLKTVKCSKIILRRLGPADQLNAASAVGKVTLRDSRIGNAEIEGNVGGVAVENVDASERLTVSSVVGKISLEDVTAYELIVLTALGRMSWENVEAPYSTQASIF